MRTSVSAVRSARAASCSTEASATPLVVLKAKRSIQETAKVKLKPVQGTLVCPVGLKEIGEGVFKAG